MTPIELLEKIWHEFDQTYDASCEDGSWQGGCDIDWRLLQQIPDVIAKHKEQQA